MNRTSQQFQGSQGSKGPRVNGSQGLINFNGYQRSTGFRVSRDSGFPMLSRALKEVDVSIIQSFGVHGMEDFQGLKARGLEGERAPRFSQIQRFKRSQRPVESFQVSWGRYRTSHVFNYTPGRYPTPLGALM